MNSVRNTDNHFKLALIAIALTLLVTAGAYFFVINKKEKMEPVGPPPEQAVIAGVIDGLTVKLDTGHRLRFIGVRTPAKGDCYWEESIRASEMAIGRTVRLEEEPLLPRSRDGAWARYVFMLPKETDDDGNNESSTSSPRRQESKKETFINEKLLELGMGFPLLSENMIYGKRMMSASRYASATGKGLWGKCEIEKNDKGDLETTAIKAPPAQPQDSSQSSE